MKILKRILIVIAVLIGLVLVVAAFVPKTYSVERAVVVNKPRQEVFTYIKFLRNQNKFSKWANLDPLMKQEYRGTDGTVGAVSAWDSKEGGVGKGEQEIAKIDEGTRIDFKLRFIKPIASTAPAYMITEDTDNNSTRVRWGFSGEIPYPMNIMRLFMDIPAMIGADLDTGLTNLKSILEK